MVVYLIVIYYQLKPKIYQISPIMIPNEQSSVHLQWIVRHLFCNECFGKMLLYMVDISLFFFWYYLTHDKLFMHFQMCFIMLRLWMNRHHTKPKKTWILHDNDFLFINTECEVTDNNAGYQELGHILQSKYETFVVCKLI